MEGSHIELRSLVQQGETYRNTGQYSEAIQCFTRVIEMNRTYAWAYAHRGATRMAIDDWQNCEEDFATAVKLNPAYGWAYTHWAEAYRSHAMCSLATTTWSEQHALLDRSLELFDKAVALSPQSAWAFAHRGAAYTYKYWLEVMPKLAPTLLLKRSSEPRDTPSADATYYAQAALVSFGRACELNPRYAWAYAFKACLLALVAREQQDLGQGYKEARESLLHALLYDINKRLVIDRALAQILHSAGNYRDSVAIGTSGILKDPEDVVSRYFVAAGLKQMGDPLAPVVIQQARKMLEAARIEIDTMLKGLQIMDGTASSAHVLNELGDKQLPVEAIALIAFDPTWSEARTTTSLPTQAGKPQTNPPND